MGHGYRYITCSTPCGISGLAGRQHRPWGQPGQRAQRLAASVGLAGKHPQSVLIALPQCSTPCGISGLAGTKEFALPRSSYRVLNALRHQWFGRWVTLRPAHPPHCAQRLAASVVWQADPNMKSLWPYECSTPCGISGLAGVCGKKDRPAMGEWL